MAFHSLHQPDKTETTVWILLWVLMTLAGIAFAGLLYRVRG